MSTAGVAGGVGSEAEVTAPDVVSGITARVTRRSLRTTGNVRAAATAGRVVGELRAMGVEPANVDEAIMTQAHADHVGPPDGWRADLFPRAPPALTCRARRLARARTAGAAVPAAGRPIVTTARLTIQALDDAGPSSSGVHAYVFTFA